MSEEMEKMTVDYEAPQERIQYESERLVSQIKEQLVGQDVAYLHRLAPEIIEKSIPELQQAIQAGKFSYEDLTAFYLLRMLETDVLVGGLNAISEIHPQAIEQARKCDEQKATIDYNKYPLFGMPITFKENILIEESTTYTKPDTTFVANQIQLAQQRLNDLRTQYQLTVFVSFNYEKVLLPAVAGYPELTIPFSQVEGEPQGATFISFKEEDATLLQIGYAFEQATKLRVLQS